MNILSCLLAARMGAYCKLKLNISSCTKPVCSPRDSEARIIRLRSIGVHLACSCLYIHAKNSCETLNFTFMAAEFYDHVSGLIIFQFFFYFYYHATLLKNHFYANLALRMLLPTSDALDWITNMTRCSKFWYSVKNRKINHDY